LLTGHLRSRRRLPSRHGAIDSFHPDATPYERDEWPAVRSIAAGEDSVVEEFFYVLPERERPGVATAPCRAKIAGPVRITPLADMAIM
jgi:hypothetical protein